MNLTSNALVQLLGYAINMVNLVAPATGPKTQAIIGGSVTAIMAIAGIVAHFYNPDGASARTAYTPGEK